MNKIRVWHRELGRFLSEDEWVLGINGDLLFKELVGADNTCRLNKCNENLYTVQRFTGLQDKYGKDIYEGDIIKGELDLREYDFQLEITFGDLMNFHGEVIFAPPMFTCKNADFPLNEYTSLEVIGNIFND